MYPEKIAGKKNPWTEKEIRHFSEQIGKYYRISNQIGVSGKHTSAYKLFDIHNNTYVLKISNDPNNINWRDLQIIIEKSRNYHTYNYDGAISLPDLIEIGRDYVIETYKGVPLTEDLYQSKLSEDEKEKMASNIADFLLCMHQNFTNHRLSNTPFFKSEPDQLSLQETGDYLLRFLPKEEISKFYNLVSSFYQRDTSDEFTVFTHGNLRRQNILYHPETKQVSIIGWEKENKQNIYREFVPYCPTDYPFDLMNNVVKYYNQSEDRESAKINLKKLYLLQLLATYQEIALKSLTNERAGITVQHAPAILLKRHALPIEQRLRDEKLRFKD